MYTITPILGAIFLRAIFFSRLLDSITDPNWIVYQDRFILVELSPGRSADLAFGEVSLFRPFSEFPAGFSDFFSSRFSPEMCIRVSRLLSVPYILGLTVKLPPTRLRPEKYNPFVWRRVKSFRIDAFFAYVRLFCREISIGFREFDTFAIYFYLRYRDLYIGWNGKQNLFILYDDMFN